MNRASVDQWIWVLLLGLGVLLWDTRRRWVDYTTWRARYNAPNRHRLARSEVGSYGPSAWATWWHSAQHRKDPLWKSLVFWSRRVEGSRLAVGWM